MSPPAPKKPSRGPLFLILVVTLPFVGVLCIGILSAIAIPSFVQYLRRAKIAEAEMSLSDLHRAAASYYEQEHFVDGQALTGCAVGSATTDNVPGANKALLSAVPASFEALGVTFPDPIYFRYEIEGPGGCGHGPNEALYTFRAHGDLDADGTPSRFTLVSSTDASGTLTRAPLTREDELE